MTWYDYWAPRQDRCFMEQCHNKATQFHHFQLAGSDKYVGAAPRRSTDMNAFRVCDECHDQCHDGVGERNVIRYHFGGYKGLYRKATRYYIEFIDFLMKSRPESVE